MKTTTWLKGVWEALGTLWNALRGRYQKEEKGKVPTALEQYNMHWISTCTPQEIVDTFKDMDGQLQLVAGHLQDVLDGTFVPDEGATHSDEILNMASFIQSIGWTALNSSVAITLRDEFGEKR